jgi:hypothetical protein
MNSEGKIVHRTGTKQNGGERNQTPAAEPTNHLVPTHLPDDLAQS